MHNIEFQKICGIVDGFKKEMKTDNWKFELQNFINKMNGIHNFLFVNDEALIEALRSLLDDVKHFISEKGVDCSILIDISHKFNVPTQVKLLCHEIQKALFIFHCIALSQFTTEIADAEKIVLWIDSSLGRNFKDAKELEKSIPTRFIFLKSLKKLKNYLSGSTELKGTSFAYFRIIITSLTRDLNDNIDFIKGLRKDGWRTPIVLYTSDSMEILNSKELTQLEVVSVVEDPKELQCYLMSMKNYDTKKKETFKLENEETNEVLRWTLKYRDLLLKEIGATGSAYHAEETVKLLTKTYEIRTLTPKKILLYQFHKWHPVYLRQYLDNLGKSSIGNKSELLQRIQSLNANKETLLPPKDIKNENFSVSKDIRLFLENPSGIQKLLLARTKFEFADFYKMIELLKINSIAFCLDLYGTQIGDNGAKLIGELLKMNTPLRELNLSSCKITSKGAKYLSEGLSLNKMLEYIDLTENKFNYQDFQDLKKAMQTEGKEVEVDMCEWEEEEEEEESESESSGSSPKSPRMAELMD